MNIAIILAAGSSLRFSSRTPKQLVRLGAKPLFCHSIESFENHSDINGILIVTQEKFIGKMKAICKDAHYKKVIDIIPGGPTRQSSSFEALKFLQNRLSNDDLVLIHDAARPLLSENVITDNLEMAINNQAVVTAIPCVDTICESKNKSTISANLDRNLLYQVQTPQTFHYETILKAHQYAFANHVLVSDDAQLLVNQNIPVSFAKGDRALLKITTKEDLAAIKIFFKKWGKNNG